MAEIEIPWTGFDGIKFRSVFPNLSGPVHTSRGSGERKCDVLKSFFSSMDYCFRTPCFFLVLQTFSFYQRRMYRFSVSTFGVAVERNLPTFFTLLATITATNISELAQFYVWRKHGAEYWKKFQHDCNNLEIRYLLVLSFSIVYAIVVICSMQSEREIRHPKPNTSNHYLYIENQSDDVNPGSQANTAWGRALLAVFTQS